MGILFNIVGAAVLILAVFCLIGGALLNKGTPTARGLKLGRVLDYALGVGAVLLLIEFSLVYLGA